MQTKSNIESFVNDWVASHVRVLPHHANLLQEVDRLASRLTGDARAHGISGGDINRALGDIDEYLTGRIHAAGDLPPA
ncbi:MAG TPA: hypothetical protein VGH23_03280 [Rhizomicrobium sp.]|jgi:hypothetical protein